MRNERTRTSNGINRANYSYPIPSRKKLKELRLRKSWEARQQPQPEAVQWDEDTTDVDGHVLLDAATYPYEPLFDLEPANVEEIANADRYIVSPESTFAYQNRVLHFGDTLDVHRKGTVAFTEDVAIPMLIDLKIRKDGLPFADNTPVEVRVFHGNVWMSHTPNETVSQRPGLHLAKGKVVVGGLGLGWFLKKVCESDKVEEVILVERSQELLDWYGYDLCAKHSKVTDVVCDDIYSQIDQWEDAVYLLDIWPTQQCVNDDRNFIAAKETLGQRIWGWGWRDDSAARNRRMVRSQRPAESTLALGI